MKRILIASSPDIPSSVESVIRPNDTAVVIDLEDSIADDLISKFLAMIDEAYKGA